MQNRTIPRLGDSGEISLIFQPNNIIGIVGLISCIYSQSHYFQDLCDLCPLKMFSFIKPRPIANFGDLVTNKKYNDSVRFLYEAARDSTPGQLQEKLTTMAAAVGEKAFAELFAREVVERTRPQEAIPEVYSHYQAVVRDGIEFFLSQLSCRRFIDLVISQLKLKSDADTRERLIELAKQVPTLHKLGQIIARNPSIDLAVKRWLIHLENGFYGTPIDDLIKRIDSQLGENGNRDRVIVQSIILSEASVAAVIPFQWKGAQ